MNNLIVSFNIDYLSVHPLTITTFMDTKICNTGENKKPNEVAV
jgi:hypothetical protein